ncbi:hypothetical protein D3C76_1573140 [compost metagenome]
MGEAILSIEIDVYRLLPFGIADSVDSARRPCDTCIVDQNIESVRPLSLHVKDTLNFSRVGNIGLRS